MGARIDVLKTYKLYIGGSFPRTESGRYYKLGQNGSVIANVCLASRKDFRNAVVAAEKAFVGWSSKTAFNRSQILYRISEILEGRSVQFVEELQKQGINKSEAEKEVLQAIDRMVHYAGWCDKYQQVLSNVNPVASSHFNFSALEPMGSVAIIATEKSGLLGLVSAIAPVIAGGNTCIVLAAEKMPLTAVSFAEVLNASDVPGGVVNILTGKVNELKDHISGHMEVKALMYCGDNKKLQKELELGCVNNLKRFRGVGAKFYNQPDLVESPYLIDEFQEVKTTWHPIESIGSSGSGY